MNVKLNPEAAVIPDGLHRKLCYVLHRSLVEARLLASADDDQHLVDLADTFEIVPGLLADWDPTKFEIVRECIATHQRKYPHGFDYCSPLDMEDREFAETFGSW